MKKPAIRRVFCFTGAFRSSCMLSLRHFMRLGLTYANEKARRRNGGLFPNSEKGLPIIPETPTLGGGIWYACLRQERRSLHYSRKMPPAHANKQGAKKRHSVGPEQIVYQRNA